MNAVGAVRELILSDSATVMQLASATSVYPTILPQKIPYPAITLRIGGDNPENYKWTPTAEKDRVDLVVVIFAKTYDVVQKIDTSVRDAIDGFVGGVTTHPDEVEHYIYDIKFLNRRDDFDQENVLFFREISYFVTYHRNVAAVPAGTPYTAQIKAWMDSLPEYSSDADALIDLSIGMVYKGAGDHVLGLKGVPIQLIP